MKRRDIIGLARRIGMFHERNRCLPPNVVQTIDHIQNPNNVMLLYEFLECEYPACLIAILTVGSGEEGTEDVNIPRDHALHPRARTLSDALKHSDEGGSHAYQ